MKFVTSQRSLPVRKTLLARKVVTWPNVRICPVRRLDLSEQEVYDERNDHRKDSEICLRPEVSSRTWILSFVHALHTPQRIDAMSHATPPEVTHSLEDAEALAVWFSSLHCVIVWRDGPHHLQPVNRSTQRLRDIQPGDEVTWRGQSRTVKSIAVYR